MSNESAKELLWDALEIEPQQRAAWIRSRCRGDEQLAARVAELVAAHERSEKLIGAGEAGTARWSPLGQAVGGGSGPMAWSRGPDLEPGERLGPYRIVSKAGAGGFGTVYVADQLEPVERRVALKVLHSGLGSEAARARFGAESQALARMEHPGIARIYDAGTNEHGQAYFAMELVAGEPITDYRARRALPQREVLALFRTVCLAVQHAHQKGIVHRDLKPSNVLVGEVDGTPLPKVIDFGVAKAIDEPLIDGSLSIEGQLLGTPTYMSPEQAAGKADVDTRTDVYALGVLLYELLSGEVPFDVGSLGFTGLMRAIAEQDPPRPSRRLSERRGLDPIAPDLDWIVLRCLEKERARRYPSAFALAEDVDRFLAGFPVEAAPPSSWYRFAKLVRRHRVAAVASLALVLALLAGGVGTGVGLVRARQANDKLSLALEQVGLEAERALEAEERATEEARNAREQGAVARAVNEFLTQDLLAAAVPSAERGRGRDVLLREVLDVAAESLDAATGARFADQPRVEGAIRDMLGSVYAELGEVDTAVRHLRRGVELRTRALGPDHPDTLWTQRQLADQLRRRGDLAEAEELLDLVLPLQVQQLGADAPATVNTFTSLGLLRQRQGRSEEAWELLSSTYETAGRTLSPRAPAMLALLSALAIAAQQSGRETESEEHFRALLALRGEALGAGHPDTLGTLANLATLLRGQGRLEEGRVLLEEALALEEGLLGPDHPTVATALFNLGALEVQGAHYQQAEGRLARALEIWERTLGATHADTLLCAATLARSLAGQGRRAEAEPLYRRALTGTEQALGERHPRTDSRRKDLAQFLFADPERRPEAFELLDASLAAQRRFAGPGSSSTLRSMTNLAELYTLDGQLELAEALLLEALDGLRAGFGDEHPELLEAESVLAGVLIDGGRFEEAHELALHSVAAGERALPADHYDLARYRLRLGLALRGLGRGEEGRAQFERAREALARTRGSEDMMASYAREELASWSDDED